MSDTGDRDPGDDYPSLWERPPSGDAPPGGSVPPPPPPSAPGGSVPPPPPSPPFNQGAPTESMYGGPSGDAYDPDATAFQTQVGGGVGGGGDLPPGADYDYEPEYEPPPGPWWSQPGAIIALAAGAAAVVLGIIALIVFTGGDSDTTDGSPPAPISGNSTTNPLQTGASTTTTTTQPVTQPSITLPPGQPSTFPTSVTTVPQQVATTLPPTTAPATTTTVATTTIAPATTVPATAPATSAATTPATTAATTVPTTAATAPPTPAPTAATTTPATNPPPATEPDTTAVDTTEVDTTDVDTTLVETTEVATTDSETTEPAATESNWAIVQADPNLSAFVEAVNVAGLSGSLEGGSVTVLAPTNAAIDGLPDRDAILADANLSAVLVNAHVVGEGLDAAAIFARSTLPTLGGETLTIDGGAQTIAGSAGTAQIVTPDQQGTNGYVHSINAVLGAPEIAPPTTPPAQTEPPPGTAAP